MTKYHFVKNLMECILDNRIGHSDEQAELYLSELLLNDNYRKSLIFEIKSAFNDPEVSWAKWFSEYCGEDENQDEEELRNYIRAEIYDKAIAIESAATRKAD